MQLLRHLAWLARTYPKLPQVRGCLEPLNLPLEWFFIKFTAMGQSEVELAAESRPIRGIMFYPDSGTPVEDNVQHSWKPQLIFTHGAGGTLASAGIANFSVGFSSSLPLLCFQGNMNLKSRVKMFSSVIEEQQFARSLGGRSMGARAAVMATTQETQHLVLVSYPLHNGRDLRDQILLEIDQSVKVVFVIGSRDTMCNLRKLDDVRRKMKCMTWRIVVEGADHGMDMKPKTATECVGRKVGEVIASWINCHDDARREGKIYCDEDGQAQWSDWSSVETPIASIPKDSKKRRYPRHADNKKAPKA